MTMRLEMCVAFVALVAMLGSVAAGQNAESLLTQATAAAKNGKINEALQLAGKAMAADPRSIQAPLFRGALHEALEKYPEAVADYSKAIALDAKLPDAYQRRGVAQFKAGNINGSIADFDRYIALKPEAKNGHWQRGISYYYAGRFDEGRQQFEGYQSVDSNDVENAVWRYLCMARGQGVPKARAAMLKIGKDTRVPMKEIYELFSGRLKPDAVLEAARQGSDPNKVNQQLFYAHLYLGLHYETEGNRQLALEHVTKAAEQHRIGHYMWDVARVHRDMLKKAAK
jgi:lipoprotein NlpI